VSAVVIVLSVFVEVSFLTEHAVIIRVIANTNSKFFELNVFLSIYGRIKFINYI